MLSVYLERLAKFAHCTNINFYQDVTWDDILIHPDANDSFCKKNKYTSIV